MRKVISIRGFEKPLVSYIIMGEDFAAIVRARQIISNCIITLSPVILLLSLPFYSMERETRLSWNRASGVNINTLLQAMGYAANVLRLNRQHN